MKQQDRARLALLGALVSGLAGCGGGQAQRAPTSPVDVELPDSLAMPLDDIKLVNVVTTQTWYRSPSNCGQGPYELVLPVAAARWGEAFELRLHTPRRVALIAVLLVDGQEVARADGVFDTVREVEGTAENARCVEDVRGRVAASRGGTGSGTISGTPVVLVETPLERSAPPVELEPEELGPGTWTRVVRFAWPKPPAIPPTSVRLRFWSIEPNDLEGVFFGAVRLERRPRHRDRGLVSDAEAVQDPVPPQCLFRDPDGNRFLLVQPA